MCDPGTEFYIGSTNLSMNLKYAITCWYYIRYQKSLQKLLSILVLLSEQATWLTDLTNRVTLEGSTNSVRKVPK